VWGCIPDARVDQLVAERRRAGFSVRDWVSSSLADHGLAPPDPVLDLVDQATRRMHSLGHYYPNSLGRWETRQAIARHHRCDRPTAADHIALTPGTSLAYLALFRLLADPGDEILIPQPGYPLLDDIATLAGVRLRNYPLRQVPSTNRWYLDPSDLQECISNRTRLMVIVSPHNPTGHTLSATEWKSVSSVLSPLGLPVVVDEVFRPYWWGPTPDAPPEERTMPRANPDDFSLLFTLDGASKSLGLPGLKLGWIVSEGVDEDRRQGCLRALAHLLDALLAVSEHAQVAGEVLLMDEVLIPSWREHLRREVGRRVAEAVTGAQRSGCDVLLPEGGWHLMWSSQTPGRTVPHELRRERQRVENLLMCHGWLLHGASWYGWGGGGLVTSAIPPLATPAELEVIRSMLGQ
jgi:alanine-synthesizing transaminase